MCWPDVLVIRDVQHPNILLNSLPVSAAAPHPLQWRCPAGLLDPVLVDANRTAGEERLPEESKLPLGGSRWGLPSYLKLRTQVR